MIAFVVSALFALYRFFCLSRLLLRAACISWTRRFLRLLLLRKVFVGAQDSFFGRGGVERDQRELSILSSAVCCLQRLQNLNWPRFSSLIALLALVKWPTLIQSTVHHNVSSSRGYLEWPWQIETRISCVFVFTNFSGSFTGSCGEMTKSGNWRHNPRQWKQNWIIRQTKIDFELFGGLLAGVGLSGMLMCVNNLPWRKKFKNFPRLT